MVEGVWMGVGVEERARWRRICFEVTRSCLGSRDFLLVGNLHDVVSKRRRE
jgi:hypothetical protein